MDEAAQARSYKMKQTHFRQLFAIVLAVVATAVLGFDKPSAVPASIGLITPQEIRKHLEFLASDSLKGRATLSPEIEVAANYIAEQFQSFGLEPVNGSYFQTVPLGKIHLGKTNTLALNSNGTRTSFKIKDDFMPYEFTGSASVTAPVVFLGYGITAPEYSYDDYGSSRGSSIDLRGKIAFILTHEPRENDPSSPFQGKKLTEHGQVGEKVRNAIDHGAAGVLVYADPIHHNPPRPHGFPWPSLLKGIPEDVTPLQLIGDITIPVVEVGHSFASALFGSVENIKNLQSQIDSTMQPHSFEIPGVTVSLATSTEVQNLPAKNVVAYLEGSDQKLKHELLIIGAHYDHIGVRHGVAAGEDSIYNGADDNASGTSGLLAVAKAFAMSPVKPKRSLLFVAFGAEELGLLGSKAYVQHPLFPLSETVAMLNLDMIGRNGPESVSVVGALRSPDLAKIVVEENQAIGMTLRYNERYFFESDQASFARKRIPTIFFNTEDHPDLHKVTDSAEKINYDKAARIGKLVFRVAWHIANSGGYYHYQEKNITH